MKEKRKGDDAYSDPGGPPPKPRQGEGAVKIVDFVVEDLRGRDAVGQKKYGHPLQANNGRNALRDAYEEALDLAMYLRQRLAEEEP
jgi:hypothetical protein